MKKLKRYDRDCLFYDGNDFDAECSCGYFDYLEALQQEKEKAE